MNDVPLFYEERARPLGTAFLVVGAVGLIALWWPGSPLAWSVFTYAVGTFVFGAMAVAGAYFVWVGGSYRSWFAAGRVHWAHPHRNDDDRDSCAIADVAELQSIHDGENYRYALLLRDGTSKKIHQQCFGDAEKFARALMQQNRAILYEYYREQADGSLQPWGNDGP